MPLCATLCAFLLLPTEPAAGSAGPARLVSADGAITEIVYALDAGDRLVGVDSTSRFPPETARLPDIGYKRALSAEGILGLRPGLVLATDDAGPPEVLAQIAAAGVEVRRIPDAPTVAGLTENVGAVAAVLGREAAGAEFAHRGGARAGPGQRRGRTGRGTAGAVPAARRLRGRALRRPRHPSRHRHHAGRRPQRHAQVGRRLQAAVRRGGARGGAGSDALGGFVGLPVGEVPARHAAVIKAIRLPRTLLGALVGAGLAVAGAALQGLFRSPLADPSRIRSPNRRAPQGAHPEPAGPARCTPCRPLTRRPYRQRLRERLHTALLVALLGCACGLMLLPVPECEWPPVVMAPSAAAALAPAPAH